MVSSKKRLAANLLLALGVAFLVSYFLLSGYLVKTQRKVADRLFTKSQTIGRTVIVAIDSESLQKIGQWPWPREIMAELIEKLWVKNPSVIGIDVNYAEPSRFGASDDEKLAEAIAGANVVLPQQASSLDRIKTKDDYILRANGLTMEPVEPLKSQAAGLGHVNVFPDNDSIVRQVPLAFDWQGEVIESFSQVVLEKSSLDYVSPPKSAFLRINFFGPPGTFDYVSSQSILNDDDKTDLTGKIVLIGATSPDLHDIQPTPVSRSQQMPGVEIHANAIETMLQGKFLKELPRNWTIAIIFILCLINVFLFLRFNKVGFIVLVAISVFLLYNVISILAFDRGVVFNLIHPNAAFIASFGALALYQYFAEGKEKAFLRQSFQQYLAPSVVERIVADPSNLKLGGQKRELTVLFSDIRGFTSISEKIDPQELVDFLNRYFTKMTSVILKHKGVVDKFIGDAIMAFWGAPEKTEHHARLACQAAIEMKEGISEFKKELLAKGINFDIGIGVNSGEMVVGNLGSDQRFDYTVIGDSVNLGSRIESLNKEFKTNIIVSEFTHKMVKGEVSFRFRELGDVTVKGKTKPVKIFELSK